MPRNPISVFDFAQQLNQAMQQGEVLWGGFQVDYADWMRSDDCWFDYSLRKIH